MDNLAFYATGALTTTLDGYIHDELEYDSPNIPGMVSDVKLNLLYHLGAINYLEVGAYLGKSAIAAMSSPHAERATLIDNFSQFEGSLEKLIENLGQYTDSNKKIEIIEGDARQALTALYSRVEMDPAKKYTVYHYDGAHDKQSQYEGIRLAEPLLANEAIVIVDDWRKASDSNSYAEEGTLVAISESSRIWKPMFVFPARYNGDTEWGWNGFAVFYTKVK